MNEVGLYSIEVGSNLVEGGEVGVAHGDHNCTVAQESDDREADVAVYRCANSPASKFCKKL